MANRGIVAGDLAAVGNTTGFVCPASFFFSETVVTSVDKSVLQVNLSNETPSIMRIERRPSGSFDRSIITYNYKT